MSRSSLEMLDLGKLPDDGIYEDIGCPMYSACLECPLPCCIYELEVSDNTLHGYYTKAKMFPLIQQTNSAKELAEVSRMNIRTAFRMRKDFKAVGGNYSKFVGLNVSS